jgi:hypothetical protein
MLLKGNKEQAAEQPSAASTETQLNTQRATESQPARPRSAEQKRTVAQEAWAAMERGAKMASMPRRQEAVAEAAVPARLDQTTVEHIFEQLVEEASKAQAAAA